MEAAPDRRKAVKIVGDDPFQLADEKMIEQIVEKRPATTSQKAEPLFRSRSNGFR